MAKALQNHRFLGLVFIGMMVLALWFIGALFGQKFTSFDTVTLKTPTAGSQLPVRGDVKVRGVIVGQVTSQVAALGGATLKLGIDPSKIGQIPSNVTASLLPKTLFGEKYVELVIPANPSSTPLKAGDTIERTKMPLELEKVLSDLYPLLRTVQPAELNYTLNALATALEGRGNELGQSLTTLNGYLTRFNPQVPALIQDLKLLDKVSGTYADVMPQLAATLRNSVKTGNTLVSKQARLNAFLKDVSSFSGTAKSFLDANGNNIIKLGKVSEPTLALLRRYSPEFPCLLNGLVDQAPRLGSTFRGFVFHIELETLPKQPRGYAAKDRHVNGATNGPSCAGLPHPPGSQAHPYHMSPNFRDGVDDHGGSLGRGDNQRAATGFARNSFFSTVGGTQEVQALVNSLAAPAMGVPVDRVPGITTLLFGPLAAGTEVSAR